MSRPLFPAVLLLLATGATATSTEAQNPASKRKTSAVGTVLSADTPAAQKTGSVRQLVCRGSAGLHVATEHDPSPRNPRLVPVSIRYRRSSHPVRPQYDNLEPGACSWSNGGLTGIPAEPGVVHFDIDREGSASVPGPATLQEYLRDPEHYWVFYVDDVTNFSLSHGPHRGRFWAGDKRDGKSRTSAADLARTVELRCRGGAGLAFRRGASTGNNQFTMTLAYRASQHPPGENGYGEPG